MLIFQGSLRDEGTIAFSANGKCYFGLGYKYYGSLNQYEEYYSDLWEYNPNTGSWGQKTKFPGEDRRIGFFCASEDKIYIGFGASTDTTGRQYMKDIWEYNTILDQWNKVTDFPYKMGRIGAVSLFHNQMLYVGGGGAIIQRSQLDLEYMYDTFDSISTSTIYVYFKDYWVLDVGTGMWSRKNDIPWHISRYFNRNTFSSSNLYGVWSYGSNSLYLYDFNADQWSLTSQLNTDSCWPLGPKFIGSINNVSYFHDPSSYFGSPTFTEPRQYEDCIVKQTVSPSFWLLNTNSYVWRAFSEPDAKQLIRFTNATVLENKIYFFNALYYTGVRLKDGDKYDVLSTPTREVWEFDPNK